MEHAEIVRQLGPWINQHFRAAWKPVTSWRQGGITASKFAGTPWLAPNERWPICPRCEQPLQLLLQLNLDRLPEEIGDRFGHGLLQLFYCTNLEDDCEGELQGWEPYSDCHFLRIVDPSSARKPRVKPPRGLWSGRAIKRWRRLNDLPEGMEHDELGLIYHFDSEADTTRIECPELGLIFDGLEYEGEDDEGRTISQAIGLCAEGDKLAGWPDWRQDVRYPNCRVCGKRMQLVFQLDSEDNLPFMFGRSGCGHITQCPEHKHVLAFGWAGG